MDDQQQARDGTPARRLRLPAVETLSDEHLDAVVAFAKLLLAEAGDAAELDGEREADGRLRA